MNKNQLEFGFAEVDITPSGAVETIGFGRPNEWSHGVLHPLSAQVTIWHCGAETCCLAAIDHIGFSRQHADQLRCTIGENLHIAKEKVMLCFSHCHSAPNDSAAPEYYQFVCRQMQKASAAALLNMTPVKAAWGIARTEIGVNRRKGATALDDRLGILKVCDSKTGKLKLLLLRLTAHGNVLKADNHLISPDYFGTVRDTLGTVYSCPIMVTQGASGNIAPKYYQSAINPPDAADERFIRSHTALQDMAVIILRDAAPVIEHLQPQETSRMTMYARQLPLFADVPSAEQAHTVAAEAKRFCGIDGTGWLAEGNRLRKNGVKEQQVPIEIQYFLLGEGCLCGTASEIMCEFALQTAQLLKNDLFFFGGYTNGCTGYFPTTEEFDKGGYEVYWSLLHFYMYHGHVFPLRRESAETLVQFTVQNFLTEQS